MEENLDASAQEHEDGNTPPGPVPKPAAGKQRQMAMAVLIMGLLGLPLSFVGRCCCLTQGAITLDIAAVVLGFVTIKNLRAQPEFDRHAYGNAQVGLILGAIGAAIYLIGMIVSIFLGVGVSLLDELGGM